MTVEIDRVQVEEIVIAIVIAAVVVAIAWVMHRQLPGLIHRLTNETQTDLDDLLLEGVRGPITYLILMLGFYTALQSLSALDRYDAIIERAWATLAMAVVVIAIRRLVLVVLDWMAARPELAAVPGLDQRSIPFIRRIVNGVVIAIGALLVLDQVGATIAPLLAGLGIGGLAVALALQPLLSNIFASSYVVTDASIAVGDLVAITGGPTGTVEDIGWRATRIRTFDNNVMMVPNASVADSIITNYMTTDLRADARVDCGIAYEEDLDRVEAIVKEELAPLLEEDYVVSDRQPIFRYSAFGDSNITFFVKMRALTWGDSFQLKHEMMKRIHSRLGREGITINYPVRRLMLAAEDVEGFDRLGAALDRTER